MAWWIGSYWFAFALVIASFVLGLWWLRGKAPDQVETWRGVNYVILLTGGIGLLTLLIDAQKDIGQREAQIALPIYQSSLSFLKSDARDAQHYFCDLVFQKTDMSPSYFDEMVTEQKGLCNWFQNATSKINLLSGADAKSYKMEQVNGFPSTTYYADWIRLVGDSYGRFDRARETLLAAETRSNVDEARLYVAAFGPLLLALALGLSLAKAYYVP